MSRLSSKFSILIVSALLLSMAETSLGTPLREIHSSTLSQAGRPTTRPGTAAGPGVSNSASSVQVISLWPVTDAVMGNTVDLWAQVQNTGTESIPTNCDVWFWVSGLLSPWVGSTSMEGLAPGETAWYAFKWVVSIEIKPGPFTYWARAYDPNGPISEWSAGQDFIITGVPNVNGLVGHVASLYPVSNATPGAQVLLWVQVQNIGAVTFPGVTYAELYVSGLSDPIIGKTFIGGVESGVTAWYSFSWDIPRSVQPGTYTYWARIARISIPLSDWSSGQKFDILAAPEVAAQVISVNPVAGATVGGKAFLAAQVRNIGTLPLPSDALVWFNVDGSGMSDPWIGSVSVAGLAVDNTTWFSFTWSIPQGAQPGAYTYKARVYVGGGTPISDYSPGRSFFVGGGLQTGFDENFDSGTAENWLPDFGSWSVINGIYNAQGIIDSVISSSFNAQYTNLDYSVQIYRAGLEFDVPAFLEIRASGTATGPNYALPYGYRFQYNTKGQFSVYKCVNGSLAPLQDWKQSTSIFQGQNWNILRIKAIDNNLSFYINGTLVWSGQDVSLATGRVGFGTLSRTGAAGEVLYVDWAKLTTDVTQ